MTNEARKVTPNAAPHATTLEAIMMRNLDDSALTDLLLARDEGAWRELVRRYEPVLRFQIGKTVSHAMRTVLDSDAIEDVIGDLYVLLLEHNMHKLRVWAQGPRRAALGSWLGLLASGIAIDHIRHAFLIRTAEMEGDERERRDADPNRGGDWYGVQARVGSDVEPPKARRNRKSSDDE